MRAAMLLASTMSLFGCSVLEIQRTVLRQRCAMAGVRSETKQLPSGRMRFYEGGHGPPVLFIHGFGFGALDNWGGQLPYFARRHQVVAPDLYWFGESVPTTQGAMEAAKEQAAGVIELLDALEIEQAHVVGLSFGGLVATHIALSSPERVRALVLVDAAGLKVTPEEASQVRASFGGPAEEVIIPADAAQLRAFLDKVFYKDRWLPGFVYQQLLEQEFWRHRVVRTRMLQHLHGRDMLTPSAYQDIRAPTLLVWGRHDPLTVPSMGKRLEEAIPDASLVFLEESAHSPMLEEPRRFRRLVAQFIARH